MPIKKIKLTVLLGLVPLLAEGVTLSWEDCLKYTIEGNPSLEASRQDWLASKETQKSFYGRYLPSLSATTSATRSGSTGNGAGGFVSNGVVLNSGSQINTNYLAGLNFNQNIFNGLEDKARIDQARWQEKNSFWSYTATKAQVSYSLKEAFANLVFAQESLELSQSILERRESNHKLVSVRYENGRENKGSVLLAEAYLEQAKLDVTRARDSLKVAQMTLKSLMNKDHLDDIRIEGDIPLISINPEREDFQELALETPSYNQAYTTEMVSQENIKIARSSFLPSLDFSSAVTRQGDSYFPERERWSMALTLTIPIFDGLRDLGTYRSAVMSKYATESRKKSTMLDLLPRLKDALNLAKQSDIKYKIDSKFQSAASIRAEIARKKYNNGLLTFEDWDIIESELITRQTNFLQSKKDRVIRYASWENLLGKGSIP